MIEILLKWQAELPLARNFRMFSTKDTLYVFIRQYKTSYTGLHVSRAINLQQVKQCKFKMLEVEAEEMITEMRNASG